MSVDHLIFANRYVSADSCACGGASRFSFSGSKGESNGPTLTKRALSTLKRTSAGKRPGAIMPGQVGSGAEPRRTWATRPMKQNLCSAAVGGLAFWIPVVLVSAVYRWSVSVVALNLAAVGGLALVGVTSWATRKKAPRWNCYLAGVYVLGPTAILLASAFSRLPSSGGLPGDWVRLAILCFFPPVTLWSATLNGTIFSVLVVTLALPLLSLLRRREQVSAD